MFTTFSLKKENPLKYKERQFLCNLLELYENSPDGQWLQEIPWTIYRFYWCEAMQNSDVMGAFAPSKGRSIFLHPYSSGGGKLWIECIISTIIHELRHAWQFECHRAKYVACSLPLVREYTLERDAEKIEEKAKKFFENLFAERAKQDHELRMERINSQ